jgi:hypothetical protein
MNLDNAWTFFATSAFAGTKTTFGGGEWWWWWWLENVCVCVRIRGKGKGVKGFGEIPTITKEPLKQPINTP